MNTNMPLSPPYLPPSYFPVWTRPVPSLLFITTYILSFLPRSVAITLAWDVLGVAHGETFVEAQDHELYAKRAKERGEMRPVSSRCA